jgi:hypothetical protein
MPGKDDVRVTFELEEAGFLEIAGIFHPVAVTFRVTEAGRKLLELDADPA